MSDGSRRATTLLGVLVAGLLLASCSDGPDEPTPRPTQEPTQQSAPADAPTAATEAGWVAQQVDGVGFALPGRSRPVTGTRPGQGGASVRSREYAVERGDVTLSVTFLTTPERPSAVGRTARVQYLPFLVVQAARQQGATEAGVVSNSRLRDLPGTAFESQLTFLRDGRRAVWFTRAVDLGDVVVVAQAVAYVAPDEDAVDRVYTQYEQLVERLELPQSASR